MAGGCSWALPSRRSDIPRTPAVVIGAWIFPVVNGRSSRGSSVAASDAAMTGEHIIVVNAAIIAARCAQDWFSLDFDERTRALSKKCEDKTRVIAAVPDDFGTSDARIPQHRCTLPEGVLYLRRIEGSGALKSKARLCDDQGAIHTGNSIWGAFGVAWHLRARKVAFLGLDGTEAPGWPGAHKPRGLEHLNELFATAVPQIEDRGVEVRIGNPHSRVRCFPRLPASEVLDWISTD